VRDLQCNVVSQERVPTATLEVESDMRSIGWTALLVGALSSAAFADSIGYVPPAVNVAPTTFDSQAHRASWSRPATARKRPVQSRQLELLVVLVPAPSDPGPVLTAYNRAGRAAQAGWSSDQRRAALVDSAWIDPPALASDLRALELAWAERRDPDPPPQDGFALGVVRAHHRG